jgi:NitT/TauT family transport system permease protein
VNRLVDWLAPIALIALLLATWEFACRAMAVPTYFLPTPSAIATAIATDTPMLLRSAWTTLSTALVALVLCSAVATLLALVLSASPILEKAFKPIAVAVQVTPVVAVAPLVVIWAGLDHPERAVVALAGIVAFFPVFSGALTGLKSADPDLERLFDLYGAGRWQRLFRLRLPAAVPFMLEGHKVAAGQAVIGAVVAEFVAGSGANQGLAWRILDAYNRLQTPTMFAALATLAVMGAVLYAIMQAIETAALRSWRGR